MFTERLVRKGFNGICLLDSLMLGYILEASRSAQRQARQDSSRKRSSGMPTRLPLYGYTLDKFKVEGPDNEVQGSATYHREHN